MPTDLILGLRYIHQSMAYLVFLCALGSLMLVLARGRVDAGAARMVRFVNTWGVTGGGSLTVALGLGLWALSDHPLGTWWIWVCLLLWGPVAVLGKRWVSPEAEAVAQGGQASGRMLAGVVAQVVIITVIFGLMSARP